MRRGLHSTYYNNEVAHFVFASRAKRYLDFCQPKRSSILIILPMFHVNIILPALRHYVATLAYNSITA